MTEHFREVKRRREAGDPDAAGFTLIELLIVIVVLAILAAVVIFALGGVTSSSAQSACNADAKSVETAVEAYNSQKGTWPGDSASLVTGNNGYLRTWPSNPDHYKITMDGNGNVFVAKEISTGVYGGAVNYDSGSNPCSSVN